MCDLSSEKLETPLDKTTDEESVVVDDEETTDHADLLILEGPAGTSRPQVFCSVPTRLTYPNLILAATVDLAKSAPHRATEHHKFEP